MISYFSVIKRVKYIFLFSFFISLSSYSLEYKVNNFVFDFDEDAKQVTSGDPKSVLKLEKNGSWIEFIKLDDELSDFYINSRLNQQREIMLAKALKPSEIKVTPIHSVSKAYYFTYYDTKINIVSLFTYEGVTYNIIAFGIGEDVFKKLIFSFRKEGEKIEITQPKPKPKPVAKKIKKEVKNIKKETGVSYIAIIDSTVSIEGSTFVVVGSTTDVYSDDSLTNNQHLFEDKTDELQLASQKNIKQESLIEFLSKKFDNIQKSNPKPFFNRKPINKYLMLIFITGYFIFCFFIKSRLTKYTNPRLKPYPKEMPPDFLFPFLVTRIETSLETMYQVITRNNQFLSANFSHKYKKNLKIGIYSIMWIHIIWSVGELLKENLFLNIVMMIPLGNYIISFVELPFIVIILYSLFEKNKHKKKLTISDSQMNLISAAVDEKKGFVIKDAKGKDVINVKKEGSFFKRQWFFYDEENSMVLKIIDDTPEIWLWTKILGNKIIRARSYYSIYVEDNKRIGFLFLDPNSTNGYQVHYEYDYFRLINPIHLVCGILYIISTEKEESFLFF